MLYFRKRLLIQDTIPKPVGLGLHEARCAGGVFIEYSMNIQSSFSARSMRLQRDISACNATPIDYGRRR